MFPVSRRVMEFVLDISGVCEIFPGRSSRRSVKLVGCRCSIADLLITEELVSPLLSSAVTTTSFRIVALPLSISSMESVGRDGVPTLWTATAKIALSRCKCIYEITIFRYLDIIISRLCRAWKIFTKLQALRARFNPYK